MFLLKIAYKILLLDHQFRKWFLFSFFILFVAHQILSQPISFTRITTENGLSSNIIHDIFQDSHGFLWISTEDGLNRYDGHTVQKYYLSDFISSQVFTNITGEIAEDTDRNILIAAKAGIVKFSWVTKDFSIAYKNNFSAFGNFYPDLFVDENKNIWVSERVRLSEFDPHFHLIKKWNLHSSSDSTYLNGPTTTFIRGEDSQHNIWLYDHGAILRILAKNGEIDSSINTKFRQNNPAFTHFNFTSVSGNSVWTISNDYTVTHLDLALQTLATYHLPSTIPPYYTHLTEVNHKVFIGTDDHGLFDIDAATGRIVNYSSQKNTVTYFPSNNITCFLKDINGNSWIGTTSGVYEIRAKVTFFHTLNFDTTNKAIAAGYAIQKTFTNQNSLFTLASFGIIRTQLANKKSSYLIDKTHDGYFTAIIPFENEWVVSRYNGVEFMQIKKNLLLFYPFLAVHPAVLDSSKVISFFQDNKKNIWIGLADDRGIVCWHTSTGTFDCYNQKAQGRNYCVLRHFKYAFEDQNGNIWMGYEKGGISIFDNQRQQFISPPLQAKDPINNVAVSGMINDRRNHFWIATNTGIIKYDEVQKTYQRITRKDGLPSNDVLGIAQDGAGNIWLGFEGELAAINISNNKITTYTAADGVPEEELQNPFYDSVSKYIFFCTDKNIVYFNPQHVNKIMPPLVPVVTSFKIMGKERPLFSGEKTIIPYSSNFLSFSFSAPNFINAAENEYACKLEGADNTWNYLGNHTYVNYSQLKPGHYIFRLKARVKDGRWQEMKSPVMLNILAPIWRTTWFWILIGLLLILVVFSFVYLRLKSKLEKQILTQTIRDKIASDLHDDIGSTLSSISILSELAKQKISEAPPLLDNISKNALSIQENMSDIVWSINPKNDRFGNIIQRMSQFASEILEPKNIQVTFNSDESLSLLSLPMEKRKNLYLLFKEAVNNCAKHSGASKVNIAVTKIENNILLIIADNGKGFDVEKKFVGNGLKTMNKRASFLNGILTVDSQKNKGTIIKIQFRI